MLAFVAAASGDGGIQQATPAQELAFGAAFVVLGVVVLWHRAALREASFAAGRRLLRRDRAPLENGRVDRVNWRVTFTAMPVVWVALGLALIGKAIFDFAQ